MAEVETGGAACSRCGALASHRQGHQHLCPKHYRFGQMRATAKRRSLAVPSHDELENIAAKGMDCPDCGSPMNWLAKDGQASVASLQHYRDGTFGIVCRSCNTRHAYTPGDLFRDGPRGHKHCPKCERLLPDTEFYADRSRSGTRKLKSHCRACSDLSIAEWRKNNRDHYNAKQREGRARRACAD